VRSGFSLPFTGFTLAAALIAPAQTPAQSGMSLPKSITAGSSSSISTTGNGKAVLYIVGPGGALRRDLQLGEAISLSASDLYNAGHYLAILVGGSGIPADTGAFDVVPAPQPETLSFLARPSRLPVGLHGGISGTTYIFDAYHNLITTPMPVSFQLSTPSSAVQERTITSRNGVAWAAMDSAPKQGSAKFIAQTGGVASTRVIDEVPGDPCGLTMSARPNGHKVDLQTAFVRDCSGNAVPDGTVVTFTETYGGMQSTVDAPIKQGVARAEMPAYDGARISVASGVVAGNEIRWGGGSR